MKKHLFRFCLFLLLCLSILSMAGVQTAADVPFANVPFDVNNIPEPVPPPPAVVDFFDLDPFYQQWINVEGFPVLASVKVNPYALKEAAWLIRQMIGNRRDLINAFVQKKVHFVIMAHNEVLSDIPEFSPTHVDFLVYNIRGEGGTAVVGHPTPTTGEENVLGDTSTYRAYSILIHELAHVVHLLGLTVVDPTFDNRLQRAYDTAMANGLWQGTYAASNSLEYWAEGTHAWFYPRGGGSFTGDTRQALKKYDPPLVSLLTEIYGDSNWRYTPLRERTHLSHLQGFNPQDAPTFQPSQELVETYKKFRNPNSDGKGKWVDLRPYDPRFLHSLNNPRVTGSRTMIGFINLTEADILLYTVWGDGTARLRKRLPSHQLQWTLDRPGTIYLIKDSNGKNLALFQAVKKTGRALITPTLNLITPGLSKVSGDNQSGISGAVLSNPFVIEVRDQNLTVLEGISVTFTVTAGDGTLSVTHTTTDANGRAESTLTLGANLGTNTVSVSAVGIGQPVVFNTVAEAAVAIPDPNLRAAIETELGKMPGQPIAPAEMATLTNFDTRNRNITDLIGLEFATNLTELGLGENNIIDISPVAGLTKLTYLRLGGNNITDISPVAGLTKLTRLRLWENNIIDISPIAELTNLTSLALGGNNITDISPLVGLTNLTWLQLWENNITDIVPLANNVGLGAGDEVELNNNPLSYQSIHTHIPTLQSRGVTIEFTPRTPAPPLVISGDNQQGAPGAALEGPFVVEVRDRTGTPFVGVPVVFTVAEGDGTLSITSSMTDANGRAQSTLTLGPEATTNTVDVSVEGVSETVTFTANAGIEFDLSIPAGLNLIHVPLQVSAVNGVAKTIESISDLYDALGGTNAVNHLMTYDTSAQDWLLYFGVSERGTANDRALTDAMGILAGMKAATSVRLTGKPLGNNGSSTIGLKQELNLVGLPLRDSRINRVSDLLSLDGVRGNVPVVLVTVNGDFTSVARADDPGDVPITGGQGFMLTAQQATTVTLSGEGWTNDSATAAPLMTLTGLPVRHTTPVLALKGSIVDEVSAVSRVGFRVAVKNLSTGRQVATTAVDAEAGYRLAVVDIETMRAAQVGDTLEISAQSFNPFIGVKPLRYAVTAEDVLQRWIQLPALIAYEIPAETELLANYPNPFNPETWIPYRLAEDGFVTLTIYDLSGHAVRTIDVGHRIAAVYESRSKAIYWDGRNNLGEAVASGVYFYHLSAGDFSATRKMIILK